jgi:HK97 family phage prohead protease
MLHKHSPKVNYDIRLTNILGELKMNEKKINLVVKETSLLATEDSNVVRICGYANRYLDEDGRLVIDRSTESVLPSGYDLKSFMKNPILLLQHRPDQPIGKVINVDVRPEGLYIEAEVHKIMDEKAHYAVSNGILKTFSIGFSASDAEELDGVWYWKSIELFEISIVSVPDNQESLFSVLTESPCSSGTCLLASKATSSKVIKEANKKISKDPWSDVDKSALKDSLEKAKDPEIIKDAFLVVKDEEKKSTWKFPHHEFDEETKELTLSVGGLTSAFSALKGAIKEGTMEEADALEAKNHLLKHFSELVDKGIIKEIPEDLETMKIEQENAEQQTEGVVTIDNVETKNAEENASGQDAENSNGSGASEEGSEENGGNDAESGSSDADGEDEGKSESKVDVEDLKEFIQTAKDSTTGLNDLLELYMLIETTINSELEKLNQ